MPLEGWLKFSRGQQIGAIAAKIMRAKIWQEKDKNNFLSAIERALELTNSAIDDNRWTGHRSPLFGLRRELSRLYLDNAKKNIDILYKAL